MIFFLILAKFKQNTAKISFLHAPVTSSVDVNDA